MIKPEFEAEKHVYRVDGIEIPSVTQIMKPLSAGVYGDVRQDVLQKAADRGTTVHDAIEVFIKYGYKEIPEELVGYMDAFSDWWEKMKPEPIESEVRFFHPILRYAGTADLICKIDGEINLVDYKTTSKLNPMLCGVQLEAYAQALNANGIKVANKRILHLTKDGKYKDEHFDVNDAERWRVFQSLVTIRNYMEKYK